MTLAADKFQLVVSDKKGRIFNIPDLEAIGMESGCFFRIARKDFIELPIGSKFFALPDRVPVGWDGVSQGFKGLDKYLAVGVFIPPGFTRLYNPSYNEKSDNKPLPLFCYTACAFHKNKFFAAAMRIDREKRHDPSGININDVMHHIKNLKNIFRNNRLFGHLSNCALAYGCPGAQNFFLSRYEAPLPVSPYCNAQCHGCISNRRAGRIPGSQPRIKFIPTAEEIRDIALFHIDRVKEPVVSFGQGCEGEPLLMADLVAKAIKYIRKYSDKVMININTNGSIPSVLPGLFDSGLDSIRVSLNSICSTYYTRYYRPKYGFDKVLRAIRAAKQKKGFVSINYLTMPGFTDNIKEFTGLRKFIENYHIDMIQWRNLNFDPLEYFRRIKFSAEQQDILGVGGIISSLKKSYPDLMMGYYNPSKGKVLRFRRGSRKI